MENTNLPAPRSPAWAREKGRRVRDRRSTRLEAALSGLSAFVAGIPTIVLTDNPWWALIVGVVGGTAGYFGGRLLEAAYHRRVTVPVEMWQERAETLEARVDALRQELLARATDFDNDLVLLIEKSSPVNLHRTVFMDTEGEYGHTQYTIVVRSVVLINRSDHNTVRLSITLIAPWAENAVEEGVLELRPQRPPDGYYQDEVVPWIKEFPVELEPNGGTARGRLPFPVSALKTRDGEFKGLDDFRLDDMVFRLTDYASGDTTERRVMDCVQATP